MTIKQAIDCAIVSGMTTFALRHHNYKGKVYEQSKETIYDFIKGYENDVVMTVYFGSSYSVYHGRDEDYTYPRQHHCEITFRGADEILPE